MLVFRGAEECNTHVGIVTLQHYSWCITHTHTQSKKSKPRDRSGSHGSSDHSEIKGASGRQEGEWEEGGGGSRSSKKKKKKMQKVYPAAMLGFTVNAADRPNMGEIQSVHDVL